MRVDEVALDSLSVFRVEPHPVVQGHGKAKEGLSLFGLLDRCKSRAGSSHLRSWLKRPTLSIGVIAGRLDVVQFLSNPVNFELLEAVRGTLRSVAALESILCAFERRQAGQRDWERLRRALEDSVRLREALTLSSESGPLPSLLEAASQAAASKGVTAAAALVEGVIDPTVPGDSVHVRPGIDDHLDSLRAVYDDLPEVLSELARREMASPELSWVARAHAVFLPQIGFLLAIPLPGGTEAPAVLACAERSPGLRFHFRTCQAAYFKSRGCLDLDAKVGDVHSAMVDAEAAVLRKVLERIVGSSAELRELGRIATDVDVVASFAVCSIEFSWVRPAVTFSASGSSVVAKAVRHPLQELLVDQLVSNDVEFSHPGQTFFVTGANSSGKSVYTASIGLLVIMAQVGCFVPAESATVAVFDGVFCRARPRESATSSLSSFAAEASQVAGALAGLSSKSLLLLDEFGKGTDADDGLALVAATVEHLVRLPSERRPISLIVSHFSTALDIVTERIGDGALAGALVPLTMELLVGERQADKADAQVTFLFRVMPGVSKDSLPLHCARLAGIPETIVNRAAEVARELGKGELGIGRLESDGGTAETEREKRMTRVLAAFDSFDPETGDISTLLRVIREQQESR